MSLLKLFGVHAVLFAAIFAAMATLFVVKAMFNKGRNSSRHGR